MENIANNTIDKTDGVERRHIATDKEELVAAFSKFSDAEKAQFYKDCEEGISAEKSRQNMLQFVKQLWQK